MECKKFAVLAYAFLGEQYRPGHPDLDEQGNGGKYRAEDDQAGQGCYEIECTFD
jgi:hypothetical protein